MKNKLIHSVRGFVLGLVFSLPLFILPFLAYAGDAPTCEGIKKIAIDAIIDSPSKIYSTIQNAFNDYKNYEDKNIYKLCFKITGGFLPISTGLIFSQASGDKPALISGLELQRDSSATKDFSLLTINSASPVTLTKVKIKGSGDDDNGACLTLTGQDHKVINSEFSSCDTGILIKGKGVVVRNSTITGSPAKTSTCINVEANHAVIKSSDISSCNIGVRIDANKALVGADGAPDASKLDDPNLKAMNSIYDNGQGIYAESGTGHRFAYNSIYDNTIDPTKKGTPDDGILMEAGTMVSELWRPEVVTDKDTKNALVCTRDNAGKIVSRLAKFKVKESGDVVIYVADENQQGEKYLTKCTVDITKCTVDKVCDCDLTAFMTGFMKSHGIPDSQCGNSKFSAIALFDSPTGTTTYTTMYTKETFVLDGKSDIPAVPVILPGGGSGMGGGTVTGSGTDTVESGGAASDYPAYVDGVTLGEGGTSGVVASSDAGGSPTKVGCSLSPQGRLPAGRQGMPLDWSMGFWWIVWLGIPLIVRRVTVTR